MAPGTFRARRGGNDVRDTEVLAPADPPALRGARACTPIHGCPARCRDVTRRSSAAPPKRIEALRARYRVESNSLIKSADYSTFIPGAKCFANRRERRRCTAPFVEPPRRATLIRREGARLQPWHGSSAVERCSRRSKAPPRTARSKRARRRHASNTSQPSWPTNGNVPHSKASRDARRSFSNRGKNRRALA